MQLNRFGNAPMATPFQMPAEPQAPVSRPAAPMFAGNNRPSEGNAPPPRTGLAGFGAWLKRVFNRNVQEAHQRKDEKMKDNPIPHLTTRRNELVATGNKVREGLSRTIAKRDLALKDLEKRKKEELKECREALDAKTDLEAMQESDADYQAQQEYTNVQVVEWEQAKAKLEAQQKLVSELDDHAEEARDQLRDLDEQLNALLAEIDQAAQTHEANKLKRELLQVKQEYQALTSGLSFSDQTTGLIRHIEEESATLDVQLSGGKSAEERAAERRVRRRAQENRLKNAFQALEAASGEDRKK